MYKNIKLTLFLFYVATNTSNLYPLQNAATNNFNSFQNLSVDWELKFDGKIKKIKTAENSIIVLWMDESHNSYLEYLTLNGEPVWSKSFMLQQDNRGEYYNRLYSIDISSDGKRVIMNYTSERGGFYARLLDEEGDIVWEKRASRPGLKISPSGKYSYSHGMSVEGTAIPIVIDNMTGNVVWRESNIKEYWNADFIGDEKFVYITDDRKNNKTELNIINIGNNAIVNKVNLSLQLGGNYPFTISSLRQHLFVSDDHKYIALSGYYYDRTNNLKEHSPRTLVLFDSTGNFLWSRNDFKIITDERGGIETISLFPDKDLMIVSSSWQSLDLINILSGETVWKIDHRIRFIEEAFAFNDKLLLIRPHKSVLIVDTILDFNSGDLIEKRGNDIYDIAILSKNKRNLILAHTETGVLFKSELK